MALVSYLYNKWVANRWTYRIVPIRIRPTNLYVKEDRMIPKIYDDEQTHIFYKATNDATDIQTIRRVKQYFLTDKIYPMSEKGIFLEYYNDPVNHIKVAASTSDYGVEATQQAKDRIGNYRIGAQRIIEHIGGTLDEEMTNALSTVADTDFQPITSLSFPFFPPIVSDVTKPKRYKIVSTDIGYVDYLSCSHPEETTPYAWRAEQGTGFRRFIYESGNANFKNSASTITSDALVQLEDIETVINAGVASAVNSAAGLTDTFVPQDGQDYVINVPGQHIIKSNALGYTMEMYDTGFVNLVSKIEVLKSTGNIVLSSGINASASTVTISADGSVTISANSSVTIDTSAGNNDITINAGTGNVSFTATKITAAIVEATTKVVTPIVSDS